MHCDYIYVCVCVICILVILIYFNIFSFTLSLFLNVSVKWSIFLTSLVLFTHLDMSALLWDNDNRVNLKTINTYKMCSVFTVYPIFLTLCLTKPLEITTFYSYDSVYFKSNQSRILTTLRMARGQKSNRKVTLRQTHQAFNRAWNRIPTSATNGPLITNVASYICL